MNNDLSIVFLQIHHWTRTVVHYVYIYTLEFTSVASLWIEVCRDFVTMLDEHYNTDLTSERVLPRPRRVLLAGLGLGLGHAAALGHVRHRGHHRHVQRAQRVGVSCNEEHSQH